MCVHSTLMRQTKGKTQRLIVHLFSDLNTTAFHALPNDDVPLREEVVPIHDIRVTFSDAYRFRSIRLELWGSNRKSALLSQLAGIPVEIVAPDGEVVKA